MFIIYKDNSYGILCPILTVETDIEYEEVYLNISLKT